MKDKICKNCVNFRPGEGYGFRYGEMRTTSYGDCVMMKYDEVGVMVTYCDSECFEAGIAVHETFGCNQFKEHENEHNHR